METATMSVQPGFWVADDAFDLGHPEIRSHYWESYDTDCGAWVETHVILDHPMDPKSFIESYKRGELKIIKRIKGSLDELAYA
jgi:hypothetical protein